MIFLSLKIVLHEIIALAIQLTLCFLILFILYPGFRNRSEAINLEEVIYNLSPVVITDANSQRYGFDKSINLGDSKIILKLPSLGYSYYFKIPVDKLIQTNLFYSLSLYLLVIVCSILIILLLSLWMIQEANWVSRLLNIASRGTKAIPIFILSILIISFINFGIFHYENVQSKFPKANFLVSLLVLCLEYILILYLSVSDYYEYISQKKFILNAMSKGKTKLEVSFNIVLKGLLTHIFSLSSKLGTILISLLFIEYLFHDHGLGHLFFNAFYHRDSTLIFGLLCSILLILTITKLLFKMLTVFLSEKQLKVKA